MHHTRTILQPDMTETVTPGFFRRMAVILYDFLLLLAVLFLATAIVLPFNSGDAFSSSQVLYPLYLLTVSFVFYGWFWTHGGQTLGLRSWKMTILTLDQQPISWKQAFIRFITAIISWLCFGLGFIWSIFDKHHFTWHDRLSGTTLFFHKLNK